MGNIYLLNGLWNIISKSEDFNVKLKFLSQYQNIPAYLVLITSLIANFMFAGSN